MAQRETSTADLGILISEDLIWKVFDQCDWESDDPRFNTKGADRVTSIDVSDAHNPLIETESGAKFKISIVRVG